jgi:hypothetical protein
MVKNQEDSFTDWLRSLMESKNLLVSQLRNEILDERSKYERLRELSQDFNIPIYEYQLLTCFDYRNFIKSIKVPFMDGFAIRAVPKEDKISKMNIMRAQVSDINQCYDFIWNLEEHPTFYSIIINSYFVPEFSGTIIARNSGILAEAAIGKHHNLSQQKLPADQLFTATYFHPHRSFQYSTNEHYKKLVLWNAVNFILKEHSFINPFDFIENVNYGYYEFVFHKDYGFRFIDYRDSEFWMSLP